MTAGHREVVEPQLERTGLAVCSRTRVFGDDLDVHKPDPAPLRRALELLDLSDRPADVAYVGDAPTDMQMARAVGVRAIGIASVLGDPDELRGRRGRGRVAVGRGLGRRSPGHARPARPGRPMTRAIVLADGDVADRAILDAAWPGWADGVGLVVAADGGARHAGRLGLRVDRWVGDGDSIDAADLEALRAAGVPIELVAAEKDESDTELAIGAAVAAGADEVLVLGAFGGARLDHAIANLSLLAHPALVGRSAALLDGAARVRLVRAPGADGGRWRPRCRAGLATSSR